MTIVLTQYQLNLLVESIRDASSVKEAKRVAQKLLEKRGIYVSQEETEPTTDYYYRGWDNSDPSYVKSRNSKVYDSVLPSYDITFTSNSSAESSDIDLESNVDIWNL